MLCIKHDKHTIYRNCLACGDGGFVIDGAANTMRFLSRKCAAKCSTGEIKTIDKTRYKTRNKTGNRRDVSEANGGATGEFYRATGKDLCLVFVLNRGDKRQDQASI